MSANGVSVSNLATLNAWPASSHCNASEARPTIPGAQARFYDTGHLTLETHGMEIGGRVFREFLDGNVE
ncbi:hypothetical protein [Achromobacter xylosoxidans]|uniref:hypothetical protein n=1 Tax=Alcaligenes xylosoxydans xylosoxydans TaxID=85698 RepID=UPI003D662E83